LSKTGKRTYDGELKNTTPKYQNTSTHSRAIKNTQTHKLRAKLQEIILKKKKKKSIKRKKNSNHFFFLDEHGLNRREMFRGSNIKFIGKKMGKKKSQKGEERLEEM
jgi:hypothetical protein